MLAVETQILPSALLVLVSSEIAVLLTQACRQKQTVLGIHAGHDASAAIVQDDRLSVSAREDQLCGIKHFNGFPARAIQYVLSCLRKSEQLSAICFSTATPLYGPISNHFIVTEQADPLPAVAVAADTLSDIRARIDRNYRHYADRTHLSQQNLALFESIVGALPVFFVDHHLCHAECFRFFPHKFDGVVTSDGRGDGLSGSIFEVIGDSLIQRERRTAPESIGALYQCATELCGFLGVDSEYKIMGAAALGRPNRSIATQIFEMWKGRQFNWTWIPYRDIYPERSPTNPLNAISPPIWLVEARKAHSMVDFCATIQMAFESIMLEWLAPHIDKGRSFFLSGGCFLNAKFNQLLRRTYPEKEFIFFPDAGDSGLSAGAAAAISACQASWTGRFAFDVFSGIHALSDAPNRLSDGLISFKPSDCADAILSGAIVGLCLGASEVGPRALGRRSMIANAFDPLVKVRINRKKGREEFIPVCPSMNMRTAKRFLDIGRPLPYMNETIFASDALRQLIPAAVHADCTIRPHILDDNDDSKLAQIIAEIEKRTGAGIVINTSLNFSGVPTCGTLNDAIRCLEKNVIDILVCDKGVIADQANKPR